MKPIFQRTTIALACALGFSFSVQSQTSTIGPDSYAFQFSLNPNYGLFFNATESVFEYRNGLGASIFGINANTGNLSTNLRFESGSDLLIGNNSYAFRAAANPNYGLYFNSAELEYQLMNNSAQPVFSVNANTGRFDNDLQFNAGKSLRVAPGEFAIRSAQLPNAGMVFGQQGFELRTGSGGKEFFMNAQSGNIGLGTTNPTAKLSVDGTSNFTGKMSVGSSDPLPGSFFYQVQSNVGSTFRVFDFQGGLLGEWSNAAGNNGARVRYAGFSDSQIFWDLGQTANNEFTLTGSGQNALWVTPSGETGLGTNAPTARLDVAGEARVRELPSDDALENIVVADADGNLRTRAASTLTGSGGSLWSQNGSSAHYNAGNVGIGTSTPSAPLDVEGTAGTLLELRHPDGGTSYQNFWSGSTGHFTVGIVGGGNGEQVGQAIIWNRKNSRLVFGTNDVDRMTIRNNGNVGIGTQTPGTKLEVNGSFRSSNITTGSTKINVVSSRPIEHIQSCLPAGGAFMYADFWGCSNEFNFIEFRRGNTGMKFRVTQGGNVFADGKISSREVEVTLASFPDYVFKPDYDLMTLNEVDHFIKENGHLPNMPTEAEVIANGLNLGEINVKLVEKVEELTLHLIEKEKEIQNLKAEKDEEVKELTERLRRLENVILHKK